MKHRALLIFMLTSTVLACQLPRSADNPPLAGAYLTALESEDWEREYPQAAKLQGLSGRAVLRCTSNSEGLMRDCIVLEETPAGAGFGADAIRLAVGRRATRDQGGPPVVGGTFTMPYNFRHE